MLPSKQNDRQQNTRCFFHFLPNERCHKKQDLLNIYQVSCFEPKDGNFPTRSGKNLEVILFYCHK